MAALAAHAPAGASRHPRRPLAHDSVSLRHGPPLAPVAAVAAAAAANVPSASSTLARNQDSSGENTTAESWFERSNRRVSNNNRAPLKDNVSPLYLTSRTDSDDSPVPYDPRGHTAGAGAAAARPRLASHGSSTEEYRSVIDDLTVQNQALKRQLERYQRMHDPRLDKDRLFEVKVHGLPPAKKRELEETLRRFAADLHASPRDNAAASLGLGVADKSETSTRSSNRWADSGYGSLAASKSHSLQGPAAAGAAGGPATSAHLKHQHRRSLMPPGGSHGGAARNSNEGVRTYLHDIPDGLLPRRAPAMTEKSKKRLVVRKLEQLFGGRRAAPGVHRHPQQQQQVSNWAAADERTALEALGRRVPLEGVREAKIMERETDDPTDSPSVAEAKRPLAGAGSAGGASSPQALAKSASPSPQQRPTRPLDLDPDRAQVPEDNIHYMRHLGFLSATEGGGDGDSQRAVDGEQWIYLNLIVGLAQLHTLNVTTDFVKEAITDYSSKFELSDDGRKIRWRGDEGSSSGSGADGAASPAAAAAVAEDSRAGSKRPLPADLSRGGSLAKRAMTSSSSQILDRTAYTPLFHHHSTAGRDSDSSGSGAGSDSPAPDGDPAAEPSGARQDGGPIIFYDRATFCTDLSGDLHSAGYYHEHSTVDYSLLTTHPLGEKPHSHRYARDLLRSDYLMALSRPPAADEIGDSASVDISFPSPRSSPKSVTFTEPEEPLPLEVSGVGGVTPADNFSITVIRQLKTSAAHPAPPRRVRAPPPSKLSQALGSLALGASSQPVVVRERLISKQVTELEPSLLPPPVMHFASSSGYDSDCSSDSSSELGGLGGGVQVHDFAAPPARLAVRAHSSVMSNSPLDSDPSAVRGADLTSSGSVSDAPTQVHGQPLQTHSRLARARTPPELRPVFKKPAMPARRPARPASPSSSSEATDDSAASSVDFLEHARLVRPDLVRAQEREYDAEMAERFAEEIPAGSSAATAGGGSGFGSPVLRDVAVAAPGQRMARDDRDSDDEGRMSVVSDVPS